MATVSVSNIAVTSATVTVQDSSGAYTAYSIYRTDSTATGYAGSGSTLITIPTVSQVNAGYSYNDTTLTSNTSYIYWLAGFIPGVGYISAGQSSVFTTSSGTLPTFSTTSVYPEVGVAYSLDLKTVTTSTDSVSNPNAISYSLTNAGGSGLTLNTSTDVLSGTIGVSTSYILTFSITDSNGTNASQTLTVYVVPHFTDSALATPTINVAYSDGVAATGATSYSITTSSSLVRFLTGTSGSNTLTFTTATYLSRLFVGASITGSPFPTGTTITSVDPAGTITISNNLIASISTTTSYTTTPMMQPTGINFSTSTGVFSGTPTQFGTFKFLVTATGAGGTNNSLTAFTWTITGGGGKRFSSSTSAQALTIAKRYTSGGWVDITIRKRWNGTSWVDISN